MEEPSAPIPPVADDPGAIVQLRACLWEAGFTADRVAAAMGASGFGLTPRPGQVPLVLRNLPDGTTLATLVKLFLVGLPVAQGEAIEALKPLALERAVGLGLVSSSNGQVQSQVTLAPSGDLLVASDLITDVSAQLAPDVVVGVSGSSRWLADLTIRRPVEAALDVGTGQGIQALLAAPHAGRVTAVDTNGRALAFARFNAALNGVSNIEFVEGDFLEAVSGRSFDLIVTNPPFVLSPDPEYLYRDSGRPRDSLSRALVQGVAPRLREGGFAHLLVSWVHQPDGDWSAPLREWVDGLQCDAWLLHFHSDDAMDYTTSWLKPQEPDTGRYITSVERWLDYFEAEGIEAIGTGAIILRRRSEGGWIRSQSLPGGQIGPANDQVRGLFGAADFLDRFPGPSLLDQAIVIDQGNWLDQSLRCVEGKFQVQQATLRLDRGLPFRATVDVYSAHLLSRFDGRRTVRDAMNDSIDVLPPDVDRATVEERTVAIVRRMIELGFVHPA